jgi:uncharacterized membrane protein
MTEPPANYIPIHDRKRFHTQATKVWIATTGVVLLWLGSIVAAPLFANISSPIYAFFSYVCHQIPERTLQLAGNPMAVYPIWRRLDEIEAIPRFWLFLSLIPITVDWSLTIFGIWENTHLSRLVTGIILGAACATYIVPALVEIVRNLSPRTTTAK